jgi:hypothetical protein
VFLKRLPVTAEHRILDIDASDAQKLRLGKPVIGPRNDPGDLRHHLIFRSCPNGASSRPHFRIAPNISCPEPSRRGWADR